MNAGQFLVHPLQCGREHLLSVERTFSGAWEASTARLGLALDLTLLLSCQSPLLVAHLSQADAQCPQPLGVVFINLRMVRGPDGLVLFAAEKAALELAGYRTCSNLHFEAVDYVLDVTP